MAIANVRLLTATEISTYLACRRAWFWRFHEELVPATPPKAPAFGQLIHTWLAHHYGAPLETFDHPWNCQEVEIVLAQARAILAAYVDYDPVRRHGHSILHVEHTFQIPMPTPNGQARKACLAGKIDLITRDTHGNIWLWDHKTCSTFPDSSWLRLNIQMRLYLWAAHELGLRPVGIVYNMIRKPQIQPRQNETVSAYQERLLQDIRERPPFYFRAELIASSPDLVKEVRTELIELRKVIGRGPYLRNPDACRFLGCAYMDLCLNDSPLTRMAYRREPAHSELREVGNAIA